MEVVIMSGKRIIREFETQLPATPEDVFPLLCPIKEYDWIPEWRCVMLYSESGVAELGCVFTTDFGDSYGLETWVVATYEPGIRICFVRTGPMRTTRYEILLKSHGDGSVVLWRQEITGLNSQGNKLIERYTEDAFRAIMVPLNSMLKHYLQTGEPLRLSLKELSSMQKARGGT